MSATTPPTPPIDEAPEDAQGRTTAAAPAVDQSKPRIFPCEGCGADLVFNIGVQNLRCGYCGFVKEIAVAKEDAVAEQDYAEAIARLAEQRQQGAGDLPDAREVHCDSCGAVVRFTGTLTSSACAYCGSPLQTDSVHRAEQRIPVDGVLPFGISRSKAGENLRAWVASRWFAPNAFKRQGVRGDFNGLYTPYWTYDSLTFTRYRGQRGEHYYVTVGSGKNRRRERRTRWYPARGDFQRFFDDVLVVGARDLPKKRIDALEPWPLAKCVPFNAEMLAGFLARTYDVDLDVGFIEAQRRIAEAIEREVRQRIGGDVQRVEHIDTKHDAITYKHLLLPVWMLAYRYGEKAYQVVINAATGEVQGDRPYSWVKIALTALAAAAGGGLIAFVIARLQGA
jgi:DNA-directed RNA polymerase subunit RPC12/RpoP